MTAAPPIPPTPMTLSLMTDEEVASFGRRDDAGFGALTCGDRGALPLVALEIDARVTGVVAAIDVAQTFVNTTGAAIEATYIFPLPDRAAVHRFRMEVGGRVIDGVVEERGAAREHYDEAIAAGHRAAITEEERAGVFTLRVGNLMPGEVATVRLSLVGPLPVDDGEVTLRFPLVVAPRYIPGAELGGDQAGLGTAGDTSLVPDASRISPPVRLPGFGNPVRLGIRVALVDHDVRDVASSLHAVTASHHDAKILDVQPGEKLDRDFILRWRVAPAASHALRSTLTCADDADGRAGTFMLTLVPPSTASLARKPRDVVFVIDRSGSMGGWKMVAARRAAARMIDTLTSRDRFCAIAFDNLVEELPERALVDATDRNRFRAVEALAKIDARGGTELARPLARATELLGAAYQERERVIVLVTDGQVGNEDHILRELASQLRGARVFALGIDQAVNAAFLRRLANAGGGLCELVETEDRLDAVMAKVHRRIGTPIATELALAATGFDLDARQLAPAKLPDVYAGAPVVVFGRYHGRAAADAAIVVTGASLGERLEERVVRDPDDARGAAWLGASWARARIRELEDRYAAGSHAREPEIVATSVQFGVLSRFTAFLAVDRSEVANRGGRIDQIVQPVDAPGGWDAGAAQMATRSARSPGAAREYTPPLAQVMMPSPAMPLGMPQPITMAAPPPPPSPPPAPQPAPQFQMNVAPPPSFAPRPKKAESAAGGDDIADMLVSEASAPAGAYLARLAALGKELDTHANGSVLAIAAVRLVRLRLVEWIEDVRSVGGHAALADAVEALVAQLGAALAASSASEVLAVAAALGKLATSGSPPPPPSKSRFAFWK